MGPAPSEAGRIRCGAAVARHILTSTERRYGGARLLMVDSALTFWDRPNALVQLQAQYHHRGEAASEKCLSAATFVRHPAYR